MRLLPARGGADDVGDWELVYRPRAVVRLVLIAMAVVLVIHVVFGLLLNFSYTGVNVGWLDKLSLILIGLIICGALWLFTRSRLRAGPRGVEVRNLVGERLYDWDSVVGLAYPEKSPWARLLFAHDEHIPVLAVQARDGDAAVEAMRAFRELQDRYQPAAPDAQA